MKIIHQDGYSTDELLSWRLCVYKNLIESAKDLINAMTTVEVQFEVPHNQVGGFFFKKLIIISFHHDGVNLSTWSNPQKALSRMSNMKKTSVRLLNEDICIAAKVKTGNVIGGEQLSKGIDRARGPHQHFSTERTEQKSTRKKSKHFIYHYIFSLSHPRLLHF
jgi:hypothetical protein